VSVSDIASSALAIVASRRVYANGHLAASAIVYCALVQISFSSIVIPSVDIVTFAIANNLTYSGSG